MNFTGRLRHCANSRGIPSGARTNAVRRVAAPTLTISKPRPDDWVTIHPDPSFHWESFWAYEKDNKFYLLMPAL